MKEPFVGQTGCVYGRRALSRFIAYPNLSIQLCFWLINAFFSAPSLWLHLPCYFSSAVLVLLPLSCSFSLLFFNFIFSLLSLSLYISSFSRSASTLSPHRSWSFCPTLSTSLYLSRSFSFVLLSGYFFSYFLFFCFLQPFLLPLVSPELKFCFHLQCHSHLQSALQTTSSVCASPFLPIPA